MSRFKLQLELPFIESTLFILPNFHNIQVAQNDVPLITPYNELAVVLAILHREHLVTSVSFVQNVRQGLLIMSIKLHSEC